MKKYKEVKKIEKELEYTICDSCGVKVEEFSFTGEIIHFKHTFGFGSKKDGVEISFDICESCFDKKIDGINYIEKNLF